MILRDALTQDLIARRELASAMADGDFVVVRRLQRRRVELTAQIKETAMELLEEVS